MTTLIDTLFSLPTALFTWPLMLVALSWGLAMTGLLDLKWLEDATGTAESALDSLAGALPDSSLPTSDAFESAPAGVEAMPGFWQRLGLGGVPRSFTGSLIAGFGWVFSLTATLAIPGLQDAADDAWWVGLGVALFFLLPATMATALALRPLHRAVAASLGPTRADLIGTVCVVTTQRVDADFGQAEVEDGSSLIQVRCRDPGALSRGSRAVIFEYDREREAFWIAPADLE
ncbi:MAG: NfeD family protein [Acidobacteriota bacterium]